MDTKEIERLKKLRETYRYSQIICNPHEYVRRQQLLLESIANYLIHPLEEFEKNEREKEEND